MTGRVPGLALLSLLLLGVGLGARADTFVFDATVTWGGSAADGSDADKVWSAYLPGQVIASVANDTHFNELASGFNGRNYYNSDIASAASCAPNTNFGYPYGCVDLSDLSTFPTAPTNPGPPATATGPVTVTTDTASGAVTVTGTLTVSPHDYRLADGSPFGNVWYGVRGGTLTLNLTGTTVGSDWLIDDGTVVFSNPDPDGAGPQTGFQCGALNGGTQALPCVVTLPGMPGDYLPDGGQLSFLPIPIYSPTAGCSAVNDCIEDPLSVVSGVLATLTVGQNGNLATTQGEYRRALASAANVGNISWNPAQAQFINSSTFYTGPISITGTPVIAPAANDDDASVPENSGDTIIDVLANDTGFVTPGVVIDVAPDQGGTASVNPDNTVSYRPALGFSGIETFTYTASDGSASDSATVTVTVQPALNATANDDLASVLRDSTNNPIAVLDNDSGFTSPVVTITGPPNQGGAAFVNPDNTISYSPAAGFTGTETFVYRAAEGAAADTATVTVDVQPDSDPAAPAGSIDGITTVGVDPSSRSGTLDVAALPGYLPGNSPMTVSVTAAPARGSTTVTGTSIRFVPDADYFAGADSFAYTVRDLDGDVATGTVSVTIADAQPAIADLTLVASEGAAASAPLTLTLGNGSRAQHILTVISDGSDGVCSVSANDVTYTPDAGSSGNDSCVLRFTDGDGSQAEGDVQVTVNAAPSTARPDIGASAMDLGTVAWLTLLVGLRAWRKPSEATT